MPTSMLDRARDLTCLALRPGTTLRSRETGTFWGRRTPRATTTRWSTSTFPIRPPSCSQRPREDAATRWVYRIFAELERDVQQTGKVNAKLCNVARQATVHIHQEGTASLQGFSNSRR